MFLAVPNGIAASELIVIADPLQLQSLLGTNLPLLILASAILASGLAAMAAYAIARKADERILLWFGLFAAPYGLELVTRNPLFALAYHQPPSWWLFVESFIEFGSSIPGLLFLQDLYGKGWRSSLSWLIRVYSLFAIIGFAVCVCRNRPGLIPAPGLGLIILLPLVLLLGRVMGYSAPKFPHRAVLFASLMLYFLTFVHDRLSNAAASVWRPGLVPYGFFVLACSLGYVAVQRVLTTEKELSALSEEMRTAKQIQSSILPGSVPNLEGLDIAVQYAPLTDVAGDFYDFLFTEPHCLGVLLADVTGHGVPAALVASMIKVAASTQLSSAAAPGKVLAGINAILCRQAPGQYVTAAYCYYDQRLGVLRYSVAGHPPPLLWHGRARRLVPLGEGGLLIGVQSDEVYPQAEIRIEAGDRLLVYTDGVPEAEDSSGQSFGEFRLPKFIEAHAHLSAQRFSEVLLEEVRAWSRSGSQVKRSDDITFLAIDFHG